MIIGLLAGGVMVGNDLIKAAEIRSQVSQIEKYNTAVKTFQLKYGYLPGDIPNPTASAFGFSPRGTTIGAGDGDGRILGYAIGIYQSYGETPVFWVDLSAAGLISENFNLARTTSVPSINLTNSTNPSISNYLPSAKIGNGNFVYVWNAFYNAATPLAQGIDASANYFGISAPSTINQSGMMLANPAMSVNQAYQIDSKIDDGLPYSGKVLAVFIGSTGRPFWINRLDLPAYFAYSPTQADAASNTSCIDNGNVSGATQTYSIGTNGGNGINCALSFKFQ